MSIRASDVSPMGFLILLGAGCAQPAGPLFPAVRPPLVWPLPPEPPRIAYVGELRGSADLHPARTGWEVLQDALNRGESRPVAFVTPHAVACGEDDRVYVADPGAACLHVLDLAARTHRRVEHAGDEPLRSPAGVAAGATGVFVSDAVLGAVFEFGLDGTFRRRLGGGGGGASAEEALLTRPTGLAYCPQNERLYVLDTAEHRCVALSTAGEVLFGFGGPGSAEGLFNFPTQVACSGLLGLLVSDTLNFRVQRFDLAGNFVSSLGRKGDAAGDLSLPKGVAADSESNVYVVDAQFENVQVFRADGRLLLAFGEEGAGRGQFSIPGGIAVDRHDRIWVADSQNHRLQVFQYLSQTQP